MESRAGIGLAAETATSVGGAFPISLVKTDTGSRTVEELLQIDEGMFA
jgi:hypothetical protein